MIKLLTSKKYLLSDKVFCEYKNYGKIYENFSEKSKQKAGFTLDRLGGAHYNKQVTLLLSAPLAMKKGNKEEGIPCKLSWQKPKK